MTFYCLFLFSASVCCHYRSDILNAIWIFTILRWYFPYFILLAFYFKFCFCICCFIFVLYIHCTVYTSCTVSLLSDRAMGYNVYLHVVVVLAFFGQFFVENSLHFSQFDLKNSPWYVQYMLLILNFFFLNILNSMNTRILLWLVIFTTFIWLCLTLRAYLKHNIMTTNLHQILNA